MAVPAASTFRIPGPIVDGKQRIYVNSSDGFVYAFDTTGKQLWRLPAAGQAATGCCFGEMAIGNNGMLYVPGTDGSLYAYQ